MAEHRVAAVGEIPAGQGRTVKVEDRQVALFQVDGAYFAVDDACPHMRADLSCGVVKDRTVICGWHGWQFDLATGQCLNVEWARIRRYPVSVRGGEIFLTVEPDPPAPEDDEPPPEIVWRNPQG